MMKRRFLLFFFFIIPLFILTSCDMGNPKEINVYAKDLSITVSSDELANYDFSQHFVITIDNQEIEISQNYLDLSLLQNVEGSYIVTCNYQKYQAVLIVNVTKNASHIEIIKTVDNLTLNNIVVLDYDFTQIFKIYDDGIEVSVDPSFIDTSDVRYYEGDYEVICRYQDQQASIILTIEEIDYRLILEQDTIVLKQSEVEDYDFSSLFKLVIKGKYSPITLDMISTNISWEVGRYQYIVSYQDLSEQLNIIVNSDHDIEVFNSYNLLEIREKDVETFNYSSLFSLFVDGVAKKIDDEMIDLTSAINNQGYKEVKLNIIVDKTHYQQIALIKIIPNEVITITSKDLVIYPHSSYIDLTSLFEIYVDNQRIEVLDSYISGTINYSTPDTYLITLNYQDVSKTAQVIVLDGVIIKAMKEDVVEVIKGTDKTKYDFSQDFAVIINGIEFNDIANLIDTSEVDFTTAGIYPATLSLEYRSNNETKVYSYTLNYQVLDVTYDLKVIKDVVTLKKSSTNYDVLSNLSLTVNGLNQKLVKIESQASSRICTYVEITEDIDYATIGMQQIKLLVYVYGPNTSPIEVSYQVIIESDVVITANKTYYFAGETIYPTSLFTITDGDKAVSVTPDMIKGKVDTFNPGVYQISINYEGIIKTIDVVVIEPSLIGAYGTLLHTISANQASSYQEYDEEYIYDNDDYYDDEENEVKRIGDLVIRQDGRIRIDGKDASIIGSIDSLTLRVLVGSNTYMLYYDQGIIVLDPNNDIKMSFSDYRRPLVYVNYEMYELLEHLEINSLSSYILEASQIGYSFDLFKIRNRTNDEIIWYGLKTYLVEKQSSDTVYIVNWDYVSFVDPYQSVIGATNTFSFMNEHITFTNTSNGVGKINTNNQTISDKYRGISYSGMIDGESAELICGQYGGFMLKINNQTIFDLSSVDVANLVDGGIDEETNTLFLYHAGNKSTKQFAYKFILDVESRTFTYIEKTTIYGKFILDDVAVFLDGYGSGSINFDTNQYGQTRISYQEENQEITITYLNTTPSFKYGSYAQFYIDNLMNTLTIKYFEKGGLSSNKLVNIEVVKGAIISINSFVLTKQTNQVIGRRYFFDAIEIITKDGVISNNSLKMGMINIDDIDFTKVGFYHFTFTIVVDNETIVEHYCLQIK